MVFIRISLPLMVFSTTAKSVEHPLIVERLSENKIEKDIIKTKMVT